MKVLVTGAAGQVGMAVCNKLLASGYEVLGTDQRFSASLEVPLKLLDLRNEHGVYDLLRGQEAVVHLGNIPNLGAGPSPQGVLSDNVAMNANVFRAALDLGVKRLVFASSVQLMVAYEMGKSFGKRYRIPYLPLDGDVPPNPGGNYYALSKEVGERMLRLAVESDPSLTCTTIRFPMLITQRFVSWLKSPLPVGSLNFSEALAYLSYEDAAEIVARVLERQAPGYHQYFPARSITIAGQSCRDVIAEFFPDVEIRGSLDAITNLVDWSAIERDLGLAPPVPLTATLLPR